MLAFAKEKIMKAVKILLISSALLFLAQCTSTNRVSKSVRELFPILRNGKWGFIEKTGKIVINPQFDDLKPDTFGYTFQDDIFLDGLACVNIGGNHDGKWGYIDKTGKYIVNPQYLMAEPFSEGLAAVNVNGKWGYIDTKGKFVIEPQFHNVGKFSESLAAVSESGGGSYRYIDKSGNVIIEAKFDSAGPFSEGLARVGISGKYGYIDKTGTFRIPPQFGEYPLSGFKGEFVNGMAIEYVSGKAGYIDKTGKFSINPQFDEADYFSNEHACVGVGEYPNTKFGFIDKTGKYIINPQFSACGTYTRSGFFSEGLAAVAVGGVNDTKKFGYIDELGQMIIAPQFKQAEVFSGGLARVVNERGDYSYIDKNGNFVWKENN
jgi:hypothetical protein